MISQDNIITELDQHYFGTYADEMDTISKLPAILADCNLFIDIGASLGQYTFHAAQAISHGTIVSLEADPFRFSIISNRALEWASKFGTHISAIHAAVTDEAGKCEFFVTDSTFSGAMVTRTISENDFGWRKIIVPATTIDAIWENSLSAYGPAYSVVVKIDVEGTELRVLKGADKLLHSGCAKFIIEIHSWGDTERGYTPDDVFSFMNDHGYTSSKLGRSYLFYKKTSLKLKLLKRIFG